MKQTFLTLVCCLVALISWAQAPNFFDFQSLIRDEAGKFVTNKTIGVRISLLQGAIDGEAVYTETHTKSTNANGLLTLTIGGGTTSDDMSTINWGQGPYFIKTEMDLEGGTNYTLSATTQMLSVPYALYAAKAGSITDASGKEYVDGILNTLIETILPAGFSISPSEQIEFATGNLQFQTTTYNWRFAPYQYESINGTNAEKWMDKLYYGSGGCEGGKYSEGSKTYTLYFYPNSTTFPKTNEFPLKTDMFSCVKGGFNDHWNISDAWFMMDKEQWQYVIKGRQNANKLRSWATVAGVKGMVILPDNWLLYKHQLTFSPMATNYTTNSYTKEQWTIMETDGAFFLPTGQYWALDEGDYSSRQYYCYDVSIDDIVYLGKHQYITNQGESVPTFQCFVRGVKYVNK